MSTICCGRTPTETLSWANSLNMPSRVRLSCASSARPPGPAVCAILTAWISWECWAKASRMMLVSWGLDADNS